MCATIPRAKFVMVVLESLIQASVEANAVAASASVGVAALSELEVVCALSPGPGTAQTA